MISSADSPADVVPLTADQGATVDANDDVLDSVEMHFAFRLDVCAQTTDTVNGANSIYTRRATVNWDYDASGTIDQTTYQWTAAASAGIHVPDGWTGVTDGSQPAKTSGLTANDAQTGRKFVQ